MVELALASGVTTEVMQERLITNAWKQIASWAQDLPTLKWQMALSHPGQGWDQRGIYRGEREISNREATHEIRRHRPHPQEQG